MTCLFGQDAPCGFIARQNLLFADNSGIAAARRAFRGNPAARAYLDAKKALAGATEHLSPHPVGRKTVVLSSPVTW
jgi:hypothetical protein